MTQRPYEAYQRRVAASVEAALRSILEHERTAATNDGAVVSAVVGSVADLSLRGGKRTRSVLLSLAYEAAGGETFLRVLEAAIAFEFLQSFLLIHDDWMDGDAERRGGPTVHVSLARTFDSEALGERAAVLAGDYACGLAFQYLARVDEDPARVRNAFAEFSHLLLDVVKGQSIDVVDRAGVSLERLYELKTSSYSTRGPLAVGAALAGASDDTISRFRDVGNKMGFAFQLRDDWLGVFGDPARTGKPCGTDLVRAKRTPIADMLESNRATAQLFGRVFGVADAPVEELEALLREAREAKLDRTAADLVSSASARAAGAVAALDISPTHRELLLDAARMFVERDR